MKLRSGKKVSLITAPVELELKDTINKLKDLLENDKPFLKELLELSLSLGNEVYHHDVTRLVCNKYNDIKSGEYDRVLMMTAYNLGTLIGGTHKIIRQELAKLPIRAECKKKWKGVQKELRSEIEKEVSDICSELDAADPVIDMIGESEYSPNEMDI